MSSENNMVNAGCILKPLGQSPSERSLSFLSERFFSSLACCYQVRRTSTQKGIIYKTFIKAIALAAHGTPGRDLG